MCRASVARENGHIESGESVGLMCLVRAWRGLGREFDRELGHELVSGRARNEEIFGQLPL